MTFNQIRLVKGLLAILLVGCSAVVAHQLFRAFYAHHPQPGGTLLSGNPEDPTARDVEISRLDEDGQRVFELRAAESVGRSEDVQTFRDVEIRFEAGKTEELPLIVTGDLCQYDMVSSSVHLEGNVVVRDGEDLRIEASSLDYGPKPKRVWSDDPIRFFRGGLQGEARRFAYLVVGNAVELDGGVEMTFTPKDGAPVEVRSESARIRRRDKFVRFMENVRVNQADRRLLSDQLQILLTDDESGVTRIDADGKVRMVLEVPPGQSEEAGGGPLGDSGRKRLSGGRLEVFFGPDGSTIRSMQAIGEAKLIVEPLASREGDGMRRELLGQTLLFELDEEGRLVGLNGRGGVALTLTPEKGGPEEMRRVTAQRLTSRFDPESGELRSARCSETVTFTHGDLRAEAEQGVYNARNELLTLTESPRLRDSSAELTADQVDIQVVSGALEASGNVRSTMTSARSSEGMGFLPGTDEDAVYFLADHLSYDREKDTAVYTGSARGFRGTNRLEAERIELAQSKGELRATDSVRTTLPQKVSATESGTPQLTLTSAQHLFYRSEDEVLTYRQGVEMKSGDFVLRGETVDVNLTKGGEAVRQIDAQGNVEIQSSTGRARGEKATYVPDREEVHVSGERATLEDGDKLTEGKELTFFLSDDRIFIDGREERRTKTTYPRSRPF